MTSLRLAGVNVGQMNFGKGNCDARESVMNCKTRVAVGSRVYQRAVGGAVERVDRVDDVPFSVELGEAHHDIQVVCYVPQIRFDLGECRVAINSRLTSAEKVEVRPVDDG